VIGTRPEAIKMAPVVHALAARGGRPTIVLTGQHPQLRLEDFGLGGFPAVRLGCPGEHDPHSHVRKVASALLPLLHESPGMLVVQGDTSSALGGALAGFMAGVPVAHVEAGLRTHDPNLPWPEEEYRIAIDARADLLFAPTEMAAANLRAERVRGEVHVTGNTGVDALLAVDARLPPPLLRETGVRRVLVTCHRRESWGNGLESISRALVELASERSLQIDVILHPNPHVAEAMRQQLAGRPGIALLEATTHEGLIRRIRDCDLVLSDSGGIQEEAPTLGTPLLVLREKTERPEAIASGNARLVGTEAREIAAQARRVLNDPLEWAAMARRSYPFGDGHAAPRIAAAIDRWIESRVNFDQPRNLGTG
jgi:UDP-N-acetylglucosamine 2-epimerase (non-hydrolysing)